MTVHPTASAAPTFKEIWFMGQFHGVIPVVTFFEKYKAIVF
jgi:hypothetical protein